MTRKVKNIRSLLRSKKFAPYVFKELARCVGKERNSAGKAIKFYTQNPDKLIPALVDYVDCELTGRKFLRDGFTKKDFRYLHKSVFLEAVGRYLDRNTVRGKKPRATMLTANVFERLINSKLTENGEQNQKDPN